MKKRSILFTSLALAVLLIAGGTFAWFTAEADPVVNEFKAAGVVSYELGEGWIKEGSHYYFTSSVAPGCCTPPIFSEICFDGENMTNEYQGKRFNLSIHSQSVQATHGAAAQVWGPGVPDMELLPEGDCGPCLPVSDLEEEL